MPDRTTEPHVREVISSLVAELEETLIGFRRDLHAHPEVGRQEFRTTRRIMSVLSAAGLTPRELASGTGVVVDIAPEVADPAADGGVVAFRADIDALPVQETSAVDHASVNDGVSHACGHDVHTAIAVGTALVAARLRDRGLLPRPVRVIFQPAEEVLTGARSVIDAGELVGVEEVFAVHCDPRVEVGKVGLAAGEVTAATDLLTVSVRGTGGHTARPHLTPDVIGALVAVAGQAPLVLSRRIDPRGGVSLVWGRVTAGTVPNVIPSRGELSGTVRALDLAGWERVSQVLPEVLRQLVAPYGVEIDIDHERGVPPTVNHARSVVRFTRAATAVLGPGGHEPTEQSLGGEDFAWMLQSVPGALGRLGVRTPGVPTFPDIHQPDFTVDERAIAVGVRLFAELAVDTA
ncbi:amidohydrolase [Propionibacteriaceae bacterium Y2011]